MRSASSRVALLGVPYDAASSFARGAAEAPDIIRRELHSPAHNYFAEDGTDLSRSERFIDAGNVTLPGENDVHRRITDAVDSLLEAGSSPLILGGDHSITFPSVRAFAAHHENLNIVHLDAHPDLYDEFEGDRFSHACPFARIMEEGLARTLLQVGVRAATAHQREQAIRFGVQQLDFVEMRAAPGVGAAAPVYLSVDLDVLDPAFAPGVSHREPGGLSVRELLSLIAGLRGRLVGADIVEYNPRRDLDGITATVAAKLTREIASAILA